jgi:GR25 family glycosyltransferase involved in LPS biosynthesis|tara:strand:+ start:56 stop:688 length:633 start_codon:yes stop_codon:yes gene_type:complete
MVNHEKSIKASKRCIESAKKFGITPETFKAIVPEDNLAEEFAKDGMSIDDYSVDEKWSKREPSMCCYLSHKALWRKCIELNKKILVLEHDAIFVDKLPKNYTFFGLINMGKPSYGQYKEPVLQSGVFPLFSKAHGGLPGTHAYIVSPRGAKLLLQKKQTTTPDLFLNKKDFPWIQEYYPWPIKADDNFTTIQKVAGSTAKHNYNKKFEIL